MLEKVFKLKSEFKPAGDQPKAISQLVDGLKKGMRKQTLLGATGTGKTFTIANVIAKYNVPTLVIAHNKTLAAQLAQEFREFFPDAAVHYFVSYYDYYQPEAYMPITDTYIEKDAQINKEIDRLRHASTQALLSRRDVIIVASVSCIYGLGSPEEYQRVNLKLEAGMKIERTALMKKLIEIHFTRTNADISSGQFRSIGAKVEVMPVSETFIYQIEFESDGKRSFLEEERSDGKGETLRSPDFLTIIDESHVALPQLRGMYAGDASRKNTLVEFGFRLPSAKDNRPLKYPEFEERIGQVIYTSATPADEERKESEQIVEQIIRPTGLIDPEVIVRPVSAITEKASHNSLRNSHPVLEGQEPSVHSEDCFENNGKPYPGQVQDFIAEAEKTIKSGFRVLATTLTKRMAEDLSLYLKEKNIKAEYLHSEIKTIERIQILTEFRKGKFDVLVGVNLLREGLDLPEVALIGILDADQEGFLRSDTALIQTIGRAARNVEGRVILYADVMTGSLERAIGETNRRRAIQVAYNKKHGITPKTIIKRIKDITEELESKHEKTVNAELGLDVELFKRTMTREKKNGKIKSKLSDNEWNNLIYEKIIKMKEREMNKVVKELDFETAAILRDEIVVLRDKLKKDS